MSEKINLSLVEKGEELSEVQAKQKKIKKGKIKRGIVLGLATVGAVGILTAGGFLIKGYAEKGRNEDEIEAYFEQINLDQQIADYDTQLRNEVYSNQRTIESYLEESEKAKSDRTAFFENHGKAEQIEHYNQMKAEHKAEIDNIKKTMLIHNVPGLLLLNVKSVDDIITNIKKHREDKRKYKEMYGDNKEKSAEK